VEFGGPVVVGVEIAPGFSVELLDGDVGFGLREVDSGVLGVEGGGRLIVAFVFFAGLFGD